MLTAKGLIGGFGLGISVVVGTAYLMFLRIPGVLFILIWGIVFSVWILFAGAGGLLYQTSETWAAEEEPVIHDSGQVDAVKYAAFGMFGESYTSSVKFRSWSRDSVIPFQCGPPVYVVRWKSLVTASRPRPTVEARLTHYCLLWDRPFVGADSAFWQDRYASMSIRAAPQNSCQLATVPPRGRETGFIQDTTPKSLPAAIHVTDNMEVAVKSPNLCRERLRLIAHPTLQCVFIPILIPELSQKIPRPSGYGYGLEFSVFATN